MKPFPVVMPLVLRWKRGYLPMLYVSLIYSDLDLFMIYSRSFCDAMLARVVSAYECMGEVTQLLSGFAQVTQLLCDLGRRARARPSSPSHATHNDPGILVFVTSGSFFYPPSSPLVVVVYTCRVVCMNTPRGGVPSDLHKDSFLKGLLVFSTLSSI